jgi:long-chain fatty acid transport protein
MKRTFSVCVVLAASTALAAGFRLDGQDARAMSLGNAVTASVSGPSAIYFNPAGLSGAQGLDALVGVSLILPTVSFTSGASGNTTSTLPGVSTPINAYLSWGITDDLALGVGFFTPFGAGASWPAGWEGFGRALTSTVQTFELLPTVSLQLLPMLRIGGGVQVVRGTVFLERGLDFIDSTGKVQLGGDAWGVGWTAGLQLDLVPKRFSFGASWKSAVPLAFKGRAHFVDVPGAFQSLLKDQAITADITLPHVGAAGFTIAASDSVHVSVDINVTTWESFKELTIAFADPALTNPLPKRWSTQVSVHAGVDWQVSEAFALRLGAIYDPSGTPPETLTPDLPDATRVRFAAGAGWQSSFGLRADLAYQFVYLLPQASTAPGFSGTYAGLAHVIALNVGFKL